MAGRTRTLPSLPCRTLWLAAGFLLVGLMWPGLLACVGRVLPSAGDDDSPQQGAGIEGEGDSTTWELVDEGGGFRTFVSKVSSAGALSLRGETIVDEHIGRLYTAFLNTTSTLDWVRFLVEVEELPAVEARGGRSVSWGGVGKLSSAAAAGGAGKHLSSGAGDGAVLFQKYDMPWPVKDREVVLRRSISLDKRAKKMIATYQSTDHPARPITGDAVRAIVHRTSWVFTSVGRAKTSIEFETSTDPKGALPTTMVGFMQKKFPRDTVAGFVGSAKGVAIHSTMAKW